MMQSERGYVWQANLISEFIPELCSNSFSISVCGENSPLLGENLHFPQEPVPPQTALSSTPAF